MDRMKNGPKTSSKTGLVSVEKIDARCQFNRHFSLSRAMRKTHIGVTEQCHERFIT
jgi:hypothetical protein